MNPEDEGRAAAERFREEHKLGVQPLGDLITIIEECTGHDVAVLDAGPDEHGLTVHDPLRGSVIIGVARTPNPMRQRSTLGHELGHVVFADWTGTHPRDWSEPTPQEERARAFARHLLVPDQGLREFMAARPGPGLADLSAIVQRFVVSPAVAAVALHRNGYVDRGLRNQWMALSTPQLATRYGWSDHYRILQADSQRRRAPQRLLARAISGFQAGVVSAQTIATLRGAPLAEVEQELRDAGITAAPLSVTFADPDDLPTVAVDLGELDEGPPDGSGTARE
ncbi:hypothetical protein GCM10027445_40220 [Amycolatopsis endophytica]|uniref:Zn-dependent peptidase ImmA (M78 family) n=1 Tax=Amycolatopsis endophytica TaxID=860233 RepID=A0A853B7V4_9PSEU|nr:ImmA/IrrE family metallo-endopeptidase [Amycolatopsis endophytica]NYI90781.1 Zn-dependent peptidase ImmA (M78 family) [Amycolatopsis endophytica]